MCMSKESWISLILMGMTVLALILLNEYVLNMTHGCYNAFEILFL